MTLTFHRSTCIHVNMNFYLLLNLSEPNGFFCLYEILLYADMRRGWVFLQITNWVPKYDYHDRFS